MAPLIRLLSLYHWLPLTEDELKVTLPPLQKVVVLPAVIVGADGTGFTVTTIAFDEADEHPLTVIIQV